MDIGGLSFGGRDFFVASIIDSVLLEATIAVEVDIVLLFIGGGERNIGFLLVLKTVVY